MSIAVPFISKDLGLQPGAAGVLLSAFFWSYSLSQMPSGWLADRFGVGRVYTAGFVIWATAAVFTGLTSSFVVLLLLRLAMGAGQGIVFPGSARAAVNWFSARERGGVVAAYLAGMRVGTAAITAIGAATIALYGLRLFFVVSGLLGLLWLIPWIVFHWRSERTPVAAEVAVTRVSLADYVPLARDRRMLGVFVTFFAVDYIWIWHATSIPGYFLTLRAFSSGEFWLYYSFPLLLASVTTILAGVGSDWLVRRGYPEVAVRKRFLCAGMLLGCAIAPVGAVESGHVAGILSAISLMGLTVASVNIWSLTQVVAGRERTGLASGAQNFVGNTAGALAPLVSGAVLQFTGSFVVPFYIAALLLAFGAAAGWMLLAE